MPPNLKIAILILNYNGLKHLRNLLPTTEFLKDNPCCTLFLIDNASYDESIIFTQKHFPYVNIIRNSENFGWGEGYNQAIKEIRDRGFSHYMFLNNDVFLNSSWFTEIKAGIERSAKDIGEWGCRAIFAQKFICESLGTLQVTQGHEPIFYFAPMPNYARQQAVKIDKNTIDIQLCYQPQLPETGPMQLLEKLHIPPGYSYWYKLDIISRRKNACNFYLAPDLKILDQMHLGKFTILAVTTHLTDKTPALRSHEPIPLHGNQFLIVLRLIYDTQEMIPLIQNSGIGLNSDFQAFDMGWFEEAGSPQPENTSGICGVCKIVRADLFHELGGFDPQFFMYYEDVEFSLRLQKKGYRSQVLEKALLPHVHAGSSVANSAFFVRQVTWSILYFHFRHGSLLRRIKTYLNYVIQSVLSDNNECYPMSSSFKLALGRFHQYFGNWYKYIKGS